MEYKSYFGKIFDKEIMRDNSFSFLTKRGYKILKSKIML